MPQQIETDGLAVHLASEVIQRHQQGRREQVRFDFDVSAVAIPRRDVILATLKPVALVALQVQVLEAEHLPLAMNRDLPNGHLIRAGIEFDRLGRRVAYHLYRAHPNDGTLAPMSDAGGIDTVRVSADEVVHLFRPLRPGQIRGEPWLARALVKLNELDQYDDAELVRKKTAAMFAGFITRLAPEDNLLGEGLADAQGVALAGLMSRSEAIASYGYDAEEVDREIAVDVERADALGLVFDSDPRHDKGPAPHSVVAESSE